MLTLYEEYCYDVEKAPVVGGVLPFDEFEVSFMTRQRNLIMSNANDCITPDWGDIYLAGQECWFVSDSALNNYIKSGKMEFVQNAEEGKFIALKMFERHTMLTNFLVSLGVDEKTASEDACKIEHHISEESFNAIKSHAVKFGDK